MCLRDGVWGCSFKGFPLAFPNRESKEIVLVTISLKYYHTGEGRN